MKENTMKPKRIQRPSGPNRQGKVVNTDTLGQTKPTSCVSSSAQNKPFAGKVFYLDMPSNRRAETLESDIKELGGTVEKFFSKEIKYLVSNKRDARYVHCLRKDSPAPSLDSGQSSPHPRSNPHHPGSHHEGNNRSRSQYQTDTFVTSRGKSLVERVVKDQERVQMSKILSNALEWGVKILYIDDITAYVQKRKKISSNQLPVSSAVKTNVKAGSAAKQGFRKYKGGKIRKPFVKVEDSSRHYRPIYITMTNMPEFNLKTVPPCSPFWLEDKYPPGNKQEGQRASASDERAQVRKRNRDKKRGGYCECCMIKYENLTTHLQSERHKAFSKSGEYLVVDRQVSELQCNFIHVKTKVKRQKCSVSSVLVAPGPCGKTALRRKGNLNTTETVKEEPHLAVKVESNSGQAGKIRSVAVPTPRIQTEGDRRTWHTFSKPKALARHRPTRRNTSSSCTQNPEHDHIPQPNEERASPRGECRVSFPSGPPHVDSVDQKPQKDMSRSFPPCHSSSVLVSDTYLDLPQFVALQEGIAMSAQMSGNYLAENTEGKLSPRSFSPVRKIQRKIRVYKRKRRKIGTHVEHVNPSSAPEDSMLRLWELFQSSDDMDMDFLGF